MGFALLDCCTQWGNATLSASQQGWERQRPAQGTQSHEQVCEVERSCQEVRSAQDWAWMALASGHPR